MKRSQSKFKAPKFQQGGFMAGFGQGMGMIGGAAPQKGYNDEEQYNLQMYGGDTMKKQQTSKQAGQAVEGMVGSMGPWGAAIAGISKAAGSAFGPDAYGDYADDMGGKSKNFFNRSFNMQEGISGLSDTFKRPTADNVKSQLTLGLWGKSEREKDAERIKKTAAMMKDNNAITGNAQFGAMMKNSLPKFQAPAYGQDGLKLGKSSMKFGKTVPKATTNINKPVAPMEQPKKLNSVQLLNLRDKLNPTGQLAPWNDPERRVYYMNDSEKMYIDDAGNVKPKPLDKFKVGGKMRAKSKFNRNKS